MPECPVASTASPSCHCSTGVATPSGTPFYWEFNNDKRNDQAIRWGRWKAIRFNGAPLELYDVKRDWREQINLAAEHPDLLAHAERLMAAAVTPR